VVDYPANFTRDKAMTNEHGNRIASELGIPHRSVTATISLLEDG
jgi:hypothetical protein